MDIPIWCLAHVTSRQPVPSAAPPHTHGRRRIGGGLALTGSRSAGCGATCNPGADRPHSPDLCLFLGMD